MKKLLLICLFSALASFFSCSARIDGSLAADGSAVMSVNMSLGARVTALIRTMAAAAGQADVLANGMILDSSSLNETMPRAPGVASAVFKNINPSALEGTVRISKIGDFLTLANGSSFITFEQNNSGGNCAININRNNSAEIISLLSPEADDYLNALMAPFVTGDVMTKTEYLELIELFYSKPISDEIASSRIRAQIEFPGTITSVRGGTYSGRLASFDIALADLLVLETPVILEVRWR